jgi:DNA-directed RNA polymerases I, II, and III subunit RPABC5
VQLFINTNFFTDMLIPVRCFTCGKEISSRWERYQELLSREFLEARALEDVGLTRICCRRMFLGQVDVIDKVLPFGFPQEKDER